MIHVMLDTNVYRSDPKREKAAFRVLAKLAAGKFVQIHIPHVVEREFTTQQLLHLNTSFSDGRKFVNSVGKHTSKELLSDISSIEDAIRMLKAKAETEVDGALHAWAKDVDATIYPVNKSHGENVISSYFEGTPPFSQKKERKDIPDAFIYESVKDVLGIVKNLNLVCGDKNLREACEKLSGIISFESFDDFIKSDPCVDACHSLDHLEKLNAFKAAIGLYASQFDVHINQLLLKHLPYKSFEDQHFLSDDHTAAVEMLGEPEDIKIDESNIQVLGVDTLLVPFICGVVALVYYPIYAADYYGMGDDETIGISVHHDENSSDHYLEANEEVRLLVQGVFSITLEFDSEEKISDPEKDFASRIMDGEVTLEELSSIEVVDD